MLVFGTILSLEKYKIWLKFSVWQKKIIILYLGKFQIFFIETESLLGTLNLRMTTQTIHSQSFIYDFILKYII